MSTTSSPLPICIHCGTPRPADETLCHECGKPWIDVTMDEMPPAAVTPQPPGPTETMEAPVVAAAPAVREHGSLDDTGEFDFDDWTLPPEPKRSRAWILVVAAVLIAATVVWGFVFLGWGSAASTTTVAAASSTTTLPETTTTVPETTTTTEPATTTTAATTTTVPYRLPGAFTASGDVVPVEDLTLKAAGVGPIAFGSPLGEVVPLLTASLGQADAATVEGLCPPQESYALSWGGFMAIFDGWEDDSQFVSYRFAESDSAPTLATLSGLEVGDTVADLTSTYSQYTIAFEVVDGIEIFRLVDGGDLLLWGPVSSSDSTGVVEGINSPTPCPEP